MDLAPPRQSAKMDRLTALIEAHGRAATSFQCLGPGLEIWFHPDGDAAVCYVPTGKSWVGAGEPICDEERLPDVLAAFADEAKSKGRRAIFFAAEQRLVDSCRKGPAKGRFTWIKIGEQGSFDPQAWSLIGRKRRTLRSQVNRAANHGVVIREATPEEVAPEGLLRRACERLMDAWRDSRPMSLMGFLVDLHPFDYPLKRRYFVALKGSELVGLLAAVPVYARNGWFLEDLIRHPEAPNGTAESLVHAALEAFKDAKADYATVGLAALSGGRADPENRAGQGVRPWLPRVFEFSYEHLGAFYSFKGLRAFKDKLRPDEWEPVYMLVSPPKIRPRIISDMLTAFVPGSRLQFTLDSLVRVIRAQLVRVPDGLWSAAAWAFSLLLVPWMVLLLSVDPIRRFGTDWLPTAWVSFDTMMALFFALLAYALPRWKRFAWSLSRIMLGAVLADFWLTSAQVLLFNLPGATHVFDVIVGLVAMTAPAAASIFLGLLVIKLRPGSL